MSYATRALTHDQRLSTLDIIGSGINPINGFIGNVTGDITSSGSSYFTGIVNFSGATVFGLLATPSGNVIGNLYGNVYGMSFGNLIGNVLGDVIGDVTGNLVGLVNGNLIGNVIGDVVGDVTGNLTAQYINAGILAVNNKVQINYTLNSSGVGSGAIVVDGGGSVAQDLWVGGNVYSNFVGNLIGQLTGNFYGNLTGNVVGSLMGDVTGNLFGSVFGGNLIGNLTGFVFGDVTGNLIGNVTGNVFGSITGDITGNLTGNINSDTTITGSLTVNNNTTLGLSPLNTIAMVASVSTNLNPVTSDLLDLGTFTGVDGGIYFITGHSSGRRFIFGSQFPQ